MDDFIDQFFSSSSWTDDKTNEGSSWVGNGLEQTNEILLDTMGAYEAGERNLPASMIPSSHIVDNIITEGSSMFAGEDSSFDLDKSLISRESRSLQGGTDHGRKPSYLIDDNLKPGYRDQQFNIQSNLLDYGLPELIPVTIDHSNSPSAQLESGSVGSNDSELSVIQPTHRDPHSLTSVPNVWPSSCYRGVSSQPSVTVQDNVQGLGLKGQYMETNAAVMGNNNFENNNILQRSLPALSSGQHELNNHYLSSFANPYQIPLGRTADIHPPMQLNEGNSIKHYSNQSPISPLEHAPAGCNGPVKPRVRARRGQATDPHSIAERLRREKIAERMKNLQELVPNSNKSDKASMLDEIIQYVKFLQLQVKVLSMSRLGAAGAVVPLITDSQAEGSTGLFQTQSAGRGIDPFESPDDLAFEQEVLKLMESSMTTAIQFLQTKGLCLMPTALAAAISGSKASFGSISAEGKKPTMTNGFVQPNIGQPSIVTGQISSNGETRTKEKMRGIHSREGIPDNGRNGTTIKQEEVTNTTNQTTELNLDCP